MKEENEEEINPQFRQFNFFSRMSQLTFRRYPFLEERIKRMTDGELDNLNQFILNIESKISQMKDSIRDGTAIFKYL